MTGTVDATQELMAVIGDLWGSNRILSDVTQLCDQYGHRFAGSQSEALARGFIVEKFRAYGLENVAVEPCRYVGWRRGACSLRLRSPRERALDAVSMVHAPATPAGGLEGEVISIGQGSPAEFERLGSAVRGKIAMTTLGSPPGIPPLHRVGKYGRATAAGAVAVIFPTEEPGQLIGTGTVAPAYRQVGTLPAVGISHETWRYLLRQMETGPVRVRMTLDNAFLPDTDTWNIVGDIPGDGSDPDHILIGGHWDGHEMADAALDNALGVFTALDAMRALGRLKGKLKRTLRFVAFGNEESQQVGSTNYVAQHESELERMALMVNVDGLARYSATSLTLGKREDVAGFFRRLIATHKLPLGVRAGDWLPGSSDDWPFLVAGVPAITASGMRSAAEQSRGRGIDHTQADTVDKIDDLRARQAAITLAQFLVAVANAPQRPGPKLPRAEMFARLEAAGVKQELMDNGRWHPESVLGT
ncbi:MAG: M20/M25/M40 family metallo-hydrolase [Hyphomicrobiales bacterium]|nr:M20/M25/M40 family metallo-hydrolase [Hyphomicrobiales bacterium]